MSKQTPSQKLQKRPQRKLTLANLSDFAFASPKTLFLTSEIILSILASLFSLVLFIHFASEVFEKELMGFDLQISQLVYSWRTPALTQVMLFFSLLGAQGTFIIACVVTILLLFRKHKKEAALFVIVLISGVLLDLTLKSITQRSRPEIAPLIVENSYSFPSGHAMNAVIFYGLLSYFSYHFFHNKLTTVLICVGSVGMILLIGFSRIYLGVHYPSDILAGYLAGFWWLMTAIAIDHIFVFFQLFKESGSSSEIRRHSKSQLKSH